MGKIKRPPRPCELCEHINGEAHRLNPGCWGGQYEPDNVVYLCPNHHSALHVMMKWYYNKNELTESENKRLDKAMYDQPLYNLFTKRCKVHIREQMKKEGRWVKS